MHGYGGVAMTFFYLLIVMAIGKAAHRLQLLAMFHHAPDATPDARAPLQPVEPTTPPPAERVLVQSLMTQQLMMQSLMVTIGAPAIGAPAFNPIGAPAFHVLPFQLAQYSTLHELADEEPRREATGALWGLTQDAIPRGRENESGAA